MVNIYPCSRLFKLFINGKHIVLIDNVKKNNKARKYFYFDFHAHFHFGNKQVQLCKLTNISTRISEFSTLSHSAVEKKNVEKKEDISKKTSYDESIEDPKRYKKVNLKKILKGKKKKEKKDEHNNEKGDNKKQVRGEMKEGEGDGEEEEEFNYLEKNTKEGAKEVRSYNMLGSKTNLEKNVEGTTYESVKDAIENLFYIKEKKRKLTKRFIYQNNENFMCLIKKYKERKFNDDINFFNMNRNKSMNSNGNSEIRKAKKEEEGEKEEVDAKEVAGKCDFIYETEKESEAEEINDLLIYTNDKKLNISIFPEIKKKEILESLKRKKNMQNEINKNSSVKNLFNDNIHFWMKRRIHRSVEWNVDLINSQQEGQIVDVTNLSLPERQIHSVVEKKIDEKEEEKKDEVKNEKKKEDATKMEQMEFQRQEHMTYLQKKLSPMHFLKKLNIKTGKADEKDVNRDPKLEKEKFEKHGEEEKKKGKKEKDEHVEKLTSLFLNMEDVATEKKKNVEEVEWDQSKIKKSVNKLIEKGKENSKVENEGNINVNSREEFSEKVSEQVSEKVREKFREEFSEKVKGESKENADKEAYEGVIDSSKNVFKKLRENYEIFKKEKLSPYILEQCKTYINYYYGIEKEEKLKEMEKYADLNFSDVLKNENFTTTDCNMFIKSKILFGKAEEAFQFFNFLKKYNFSINVETYNSLLYVCVIKKNAELSRLIYLQMIKNMYLPDKKTFCLLIKTHILDGDIKSAFHLYRKMVKDKIEVDLPIYTTLIDGLIKHKLYKRAEKFYYYILNYKNVVPDEILFSVMIKNCAYNAEAEKCLNFYDEMVNNNMRITDITIIEIIHCLSKRKDYFYKVFHFYNIYLANEMKITHRLMLYMIIACSNSGNIKRLKEILKVINKNKIKITIEMYSYIIKAFANNCLLKGVTLGEKNNNIIYAWAVVQHVLKCNELANNNNSGITQIIQNKNVNKESSKNSVITTKILNSIILLYSNCNYYEYAINMLKYYDCFQCCPDFSTFHLLYKMLFYQMRDYGKVLALYNFMIKNTTIKPDERIFHLVLNAAIETKSSKNTIFILRDMLTNKIYPSYKTVKKLFHVGRHITDIQLLINSMIKQQKKDTFDKNVSENRLIQLNIDEYELNLFKDGKTFKTKSELDQVRDRYFNRKEKIEKEKRMSKGKKSSNWLPYGQYLQQKQKGGEAYAKKVDRPRPHPWD